MALQLWNTLDDVIYYVVTGLFGWPDDHHKGSRAFKEQMEPLPPPLQVGEELDQCDGSEDVSQSRYQVFLSFRGEDTRRNFTSHLLKALKDCGIDVFCDEEKLEKGEELSPTLLNAIAASKVSIIILSKDYASSRSCLIELSKIMECKLTKGQVVLPIFYKVNPFDVRHHTGSFEESFNHHLITKPKEVQAWKVVFTQVGNLKGWHIDGGIFGRSETEYIKDVIEVVMKKLSCKATSKSEELFGIDDNFEKILLLINQQDIRIIGIWGMGGIGKTTLAEAVYNEVLCHSKFDAHHFFQNVHDRSLEKFGMQSLQDDLLSKLLKVDIHIDTRFIGSTLIQDRLRNLRVFVVFDDVNNLDQIKRLGVEYFGPGSKIIVTSRDRQVLENIEVDEVHRAKELNEKDSLQLFCKFAFKQYNPFVGFRDLAMKFVQYAGGNPLALKVFGAALYRKSRDVWRSALDKLKEYPEQDIFRPLEISYDRLGDLEKNIFLDIACFFKWDDKDYVTNVLKCYYKGAEFGISTLVDKCLVDVSYDNIRMHGLLQEMGRDIVRRESEDAGRRSRLWSFQDVYHVLKNNKGTESIKKISLDMYQMKATLHICPTIFEKMVNLVFLRFLGCHKLLLLNQDITYLPDTLRYLYWEGYPSKCLPSNFSPSNLIELSLALSKMEQLWNGDQDVVHLRVMDLYGCKKLRKIPNLLGAIKLERLVCSGCKSLSELPSMMHWTSLKELDLSDCPITKFPEIPRNGALEVLYLDGTQIEEVPSFIGSLKKLQSLDMRGTKIQNVPSSILKLDALVEIYLSGCPNLTELNLSMTPMEEVASSISGLQKSLRTLLVSDCKSLKSLSALPPSLYLRAEGCTSLERVSFIDHEDHCYLPALSSRYDFRDCFNLSQDARSNIIAAYPTIRSQSIAKKYANKLLAGCKLELDEYWHEFYSERPVICDLPGFESPDKFENQSSNSYITVKLDSATSRRFLCFTLCLVLDFDFPQHVTYNISCKYQLKGIDGGQNFKTSWIYEPQIAKCFSERLIYLFGKDMVHRDLHYYKEASFNFHVVATYPTAKEIKVEKCGVHVFYVDAGSFAVSDVGSSIINCRSDEDNRCSPNIFQPNSLIGPSWLSLEFDAHSADFGGSIYG